MLKKCSEKNSSENPDNKKIVALIPARGGSKSIPKKNIQNFCGKPLVYWTVQAAAQCSLIDAVYVATDDSAIRKVVNDFELSKVQVIDRSPETATDSASTEAVMLEFSRQYDFQDIVLIQPTSPLLETADLANGIKQYIENKVDSLLSVVRQKRFIWAEQHGQVSAVNYDPLQRPRRQEWEGYFVENGAFYITGRSNLLKSKCRISGKVMLYEMSEDGYFEIDEPSDWIIAEQLKYERLKNKTVNFCEINLMICDVDGVLTDAGMYYSDSGDAFKKFHTRDGKGIELLRQNNIKVMFLTGEDTDIVRKRAEKLHIDFVFLGIKDKKGFLEDFFRQNPDYSFAKTAYIGDDINDQDCIRLSRYSATPSDGHPVIKSLVHYVCTFRGGRGCVREFCDLIIAGRSHVSL